MKVRWEFGMQGDKGHGAEPLQAYRAAVGTGVVLGSSLPYLQCLVGPQPAHQVNLILLACFSCLICPVSVVRSSSSPSFQRQCAEPSLMEGQKNGSITNPENKKSMVNFSAILASFTF